MPSSKSCGDRQKDHLDQINSVLTRQTTEGRQTDKRQAEADGKTCLDLINNVITNQMIQP
jgi:hypothetical protein